MKYYRIEVTNNEGIKSNIPYDSADDLIIKETDINQWKTMLLEQKVDFIFAYEDKTAHYTPLGYYVKIIDKKTAEGSHNCSSFLRMITFRKCHFNIEKDPACDFCIYCGSPEERL